MEFVAQTEPLTAHSLEEKKSPMEALAHLRPSPLRTSAAAAASAFVALSLDEDEACSPSLSLSFNAASRSTSFGTSSSSSSPLSLSLWGRRGASPTNRLLQRMPVRPRSPTDEEPCVLSPRSILRRKISQSASAEIEFCEHVLTDVETETESEHEEKGDKEEEE